MEHLKLHTTHQSFQDEKYTINMPWVSYNEDNENVYYSSDFKKGLKFIALEDISITIIPTLGDDKNRSTFEHNTSFVCVNSEGEILTTDIQNNPQTVRSGDYVWVHRSDVNPIEEQNATKKFIFNINGRFNLEGNVDDFLNNDGVTPPYACYDLFENCSGLIDASKLKLTKTLNSYCYGDMFEKCSKLIATPIFRHRTLFNSCYNSMFTNCTSLTKAPELPATTLADKCYNGMFYGCTALTEAPELPATTLASNCYASMFEGCTALTEAPELPATTMVDYCYYAMFRNCRSLSEAPELPSTSLAAQCYRNMFTDCISLTKAPELPATTMVDYCYNNMFANCTSLTIAPTVLPALTLAEQCYGQMFFNTGVIKSPDIKATQYAPGSCYGMFRSCHSLAEIKCHVTSVDNSDSVSTKRQTYKWTFGHGVPVGVFYNLGNCDFSNEDPGDGIPSGWIVKYEE